MWLDGWEVGGCYWGWDGISKTENSKIYCIDYSIHVQCLWICSIQLYVICIYQMYIGTDTMPPGTH